MFLLSNSEMWLLERDVLLAVVREPDSQESKDNQIASLFLMSLETFLVTCGTVLQVPSADSYDASCKWVLATSKRQFSCRSLRSTACATAVILSSNTWVGCPSSARNSLSSWVACGPFSEALIYRAKEVFELRKRSATCLFYIFQTAHSKNCDAFPCLFAMGQVLLKGWSL